MKIICFDVDGTLVDNKSSWITIIQALGCSVPEVLSIYQGAMTGKIPFAEGEKLVAEIFRASGKATKKFLQQIFGEVVFKPGALEIVQYLKAKGYDIWLISGAIDVYVASVAKSIGAAGFYAHSSLEFDDNGVLSKINYAGDQNPWKAEKIRELSKEFNIPANEIFFVGDSLNDIEAFKLTGRGIAVEPFEEELGRVAWKKIRSLAELKDIIDS